MYSNERFDAISEYLKKNKKASVAELSDLLFVSSATVRRDLLEMQKLGLIARTHGGALYLENTDEVSIFVRVEKNAKEKEETATVALNHLPPFQTVFIDNSSTCLALVKRMALTHKTVITNGLQVALKISQKENVNTIMPGGEIHFNTNSVAGSQACSFLHRLNLDLMLCSCAAIQPSGAFEASMEPSELKRAAMQHCRKKYLIVDESKFLASAPYKYADLSEFDAIITNADESILAPYRQMGLTIFNTVR